MSETDELKSELLCKVTYVREQVREGKLHIQYDDQDV